MLLRISRFDDLDERKLMDIYSESNFENTDYFFPDLEDKKYTDHASREICRQEGVSMLVLT